MPFTVTMPKLSPTMDEGTLVKWHVQEGEKVEAGAVLIEVATDKATVEHNAIDEGFLRKILVAEGTAAKVNQPIAIFTETADESIEGYEPEGEAAPAAEEPAPQKEGEEEEKGDILPPPPSGGGMEQPAFVPEPPLEGVEFKRGAPFHGRILASPLARKIAADKGIDLSGVKGSGPRSRIVSKDLEGMEGGAQFGTHSFPTEAPGAYEEESLTPIRKVIGRRLQESKTFIPHFYVTQEFDAEPMHQLREQFKSGGLRVSFNDLIVRGCSLALKKHPEMNSGFNTVNQSIIRFKTIDISIAVSLPDGLITPIVRYADAKNLGEISTEVRSLVKKARDGKLEREEYTGGSFTISNLGMFGVSDFVAVINPPQAAILAIGGIQNKPVLKEGRVVPGKTMAVTLSADHRVVDGVDGAKFLQTLQTYLENPSLMVI